MFSRKDDFSKQKLIVKIVRPLDTFDMLSRELSANWNNQWTKPKQTYELHEESDDHISTKWEFEATIPIDRFDRPIVLNDKELFIVPYNSHYWQTNGLYKYNIDQKKWTEWIKFPSNVRTSFHTSAYDKVNNLLYIYNKEALLIIINLNTEQCFIHQVRRYGKYAASIVINGQFHLIGGFRSNKHLVWDYKMNQFIEIYHFKEWGIGYYLHKLCYVESRQLLFCVGGYTSTSRQSRSTDHIYVYDVKSKLWNRSHTNMPRRMYSFGYILTPNEKYLIIFGGNDTNHIHLFDIMNHNMVKLDITCPTSGGFTACVMGNYKLDNYLVSGFIRRQWRLPYYKNVRCLSYDVIKILQKWYSTEEIHVIHINKKGHWKIKLAQIVNDYHRKYNAYVNEN